LSGCSAKYRISRNLSSKSFKAGKVHKCRHRPINDFDLQGVGSFVNARPRAGSKDTRRFWRLRKGLPLPLAQVTVQWPLSAQRRQRLRRSRMVRSLPRSRIYKWRGRRRQSRASAGFDRFTS
jgi:hypothetical protein